MSLSNLFSSGLPFWYELLFYFGSMILGLYLLLLAGLAITQIHRHPREIRWFLAAICATLFAQWGLDRLHKVVHFLLQSLGTPLNGSELVLLITSFVYTLIGLLLTATVWVCVLRAVLALGAEDQEIAAEFADEASP